jgi:quercetin dioxygenase-like cupin family protein
MSTVPKSKILRLEDLVAYQDGSVVSRQITKAESGNVTLFAFDAGQELSEHTTPHDALAHVLEGQLEVRIAGKLSILNSGDGIIMPAGAPHAVRAPVRCKMLLTMVRA